MPSSETFEARVDNTLDLINCERIQTIRMLVAELGHSINIGDEDMRRYLSSVDPDTAEQLHTLGNVQELIPILPHTMLPFSLYPEKSLEAAGGIHLVQKEAVATVRAACLYLGLLCDGGKELPISLESFFQKAVAGAMAERAMFLSGKYSLNLPADWARVPLRTSYEALFMIGRSDNRKHYTVSPEEIQACLRAGGDPSQLHVDATYINRVFVRERTYALNSFLKNNPPYDFAEKVLGGEEFQRLMAVERGDAIQVYRLQ